MLLLRTYLARDSTISAHTILTTTFFNRHPLKVAKELLGKVLCVKHKNIWLKAIITETEAYYLHDKASHSYLGYTEKRKALFMRPGTIYMYYSQGGDSLNISCRGAGNAVLIKTARPYLEGKNTKKMIYAMQFLNPKKNTTKLRIAKELCNGQALLCRSLGLKVTDWDQKQFDRKKFYIASCGYQPQDIIRAKRLGIPKGRNEHLLYRFIWRDLKCKV
ncbi:putative 3-methyladenine DNA glycosylase [Gammaproteobacteria bacterium]